MSAVDSPFDTLELEYDAAPRGWVYFIACTETLRCKIGFTKGDPEDRLRSLQTGSAARLRFVAKQPGSPDIERKLHERFAGHRRHGEWFDMHTELFAYICALVWVTARIGLRHQILPEEWVIVGLRMMDDGLCELPDDLKALIARPS